MQNTILARNTGKSFQPAKNPFFSVSNPEPLAIGEKQVTTAAQAMTVIAYGDSNGLKMRCLNFKTECENFADLMACIEIIDSYNEFDAERIKKAAFWELNLKHYLNEKNPNNGNDFFDFHIAREGSPAFYVVWNEKYNNKVIKDIEQVEPSEGQEPGTMIYWQEYTKEDFKASMGKLNSLMGSDEFDIEEDYTYEDGKKSFTARFWFD